MLGMAVICSQTQSTEALTLPLPHLPTFTGDAGATIALARTCKLRLVNEHFLVENLARKAPPLELIHCAGLKLCTQKHT